MPSWPTGIDTIKKFIDNGDLQKVTASLDAAHGFLTQAAGHLDSAETVAVSDPTGAHALLYDAARKASPRYFTFKAYEPPARAATT